MSRRGSKRSKTYTAFANSNSDEESHEQSSSPKVSESDDIKKFMDDEDEIPSVNKPEEDNEEEEEEEDEIEEFSDDKDAESYKRSPKKQKTQHEQEKEEDEQEEEEQEEQDKEKANSSDESPEKSDPIIDFFDEIVVKKSTPVVDTKSSVNAENDAWLLKLKDALMKKGKSIESLIDDITDSKSTSSSSDSTVKKVAAGRSPSSSSTASSRSVVVDETPLPLPLTREEYREKHEPKYYKLLSDLIVYKGFSSANDDQLTELISDIESTLQQKFSELPKGCKTFADYTKRYGGSAYNLLIEIKNHKWSGDDDDHDALFDKITDHLAEINDNLEKSFQESIAFMHPDYTMELFCKASGINCHASSNLDVKNAQVWCVTKKKPKSKNENYISITFNSPSGATNVMGIHCKNLAMFTPAAVVGDYVNAYPNGNYMTKYGPSFPQQSQFKITLVENVPGVVFDGSWSERHGKAGLVVPHTHTCKGFDKIQDLNRKFVESAWSAPNFATKIKNECKKTADSQTEKEFENKNTSGLSKKQIEREKEDALERNHKTAFEMSVKPSFGTNDYGKRIIKGIHDIYGWETDAQKAARFSDPYIPLTELDRLNYYYPNQLTKKAVGEGEEDTGPPKRKYAIPLRRRDLPFFRAVTYDEYIKDREAGLVDRNYKPFKPVPFEEIRLMTNDVVVALVELVPDSELCRLKVEYKALIWIGEAGSLDFSHKPLTKRDDLSKFFYAATPYYLREKTLEKHEMKPDPSLLQQDLKHLESIMLEEEEYKSNRR